MPPPQKSPRVPAPALPRREMLKSLVAGGFSLAALRLRPVAAHGAPTADAAEQPALPPNTPRPVSVERVSQPLLRLDGTWRFHPDAPEDFWREDYTPAGAGWRELAVPGEWAMQGAKVESGSAAAYWREFELSADWGGLVCKLRFDSVHASCRVWVNGTEVGGHDGGFVEFEFDVTAAVRPGRNTLAVAVQGDGEADMLSYASKYAAHPLGGISRKVTLFAVPAVHVSGLDIRTLRDAAGKCRLHVQAEVANAGTTPAAAGNLELTLDGAALARVAYGPLPSAGRAVVSHVAEVPGAQPWDNEHPHLHELRIGCRGCTVVRRIGFREISVRGNELFINGRPVKLRGVNRHEVHFHRGRAANADLARGDVELFRAANVNLIRTSHYPPPEELLEACDELGMLVDCEAALCWVGMRSRPEWKVRSPDDAGLYPALLRANLANVAAHRHHASVICWSLANESVWTENFSRVNAVVKGIDPTRPTIFHSDRLLGNGTADLANCHYPRPDQLGGLLRNDGRPVLVGEHAHTQSYNRSEVAADPGVRENWGRVFEETAVTIFETPHLLGSAIWAGIDDLFQIHGGPVVGYGEWGLVDVRRRPKPEYWHVKKAWSPVRVTVRTLPVPAPGEPLRVPVWNRGDFSDLGEFAIRWRVGQQSGAITANLPPRARGELVLPKEAGLERGMTLRLEFLDPRGLLVDEEEIAIGVSAGTSPRRPFPESRVAARNPDGRVGPWEFKTDPATGFTLLARSGEPVLTAAELMLLPLEEMKWATTNDYKTDIPPLHHMCARRKLVQLQHLEGREGLGARLQLEWREAVGQMDLLLERAGHLSVQGHFRLREKITARQCGLVFWLPARFSRLAWNRQSVWTTYPSDHIGRPVGETPARWPAAADSTQANVPWSHERGPLGPHDLCATRTQVNWAELRADDGTKVRIDGGGRQAVRAWLESDGRIGVLVAEFSGGGNEPDFAYFARGFRELHPGDEIELSARLTLVH